MLKSHPEKLIAVCLVLCSWLVLSSYAVARGDEPQRLEVHEWSVWVSDPTQNLLNAMAAYPSAMPGLVDTQRSRRTEPDRPNVSPLSMISLWGRPPEFADLSLRMANGRFVGHWPPAETKNNRLAWNDLKLSAENTDGAFGFVSDDHWFVQARKLNALQIQRGARAERFMVYDPELNVALSVRVDGGPDRYQVVNASRYLLKDILLVAPTSQGRRIGWLDELPGAKDAPALPPAPAAPAPVAATRTMPQPAPVAAIAAAARAVAAKAVEITARAAPVGNQPAADKPAANQTETSADLEMSAPLTDEQLTAQTVGALRSRLEAAGLKPEELDLLLSLYGKSLFEANETVLLFRLPQSTIDQWLPLEVDPETAKITRVALVLCFKVDPLIRSEVKQLIEQLGDADYTKREQSEQRLRDLGRLAIPALKEAVKSPDPERVLRAERLLLRQNERLVGK